MTGNPFIRLAGRSGLRSLMVIMSLLAATVVVAPAASAASDCYPNNDGSEELIVLIDDDDGDEVVLEMRDNVLYVDGEACGTPGAPATGDIRHSIFIGDGLVGDGTAKVDRVQINLAAGPWQVDGVPVFVNIRLEGGPNQVSDHLTIRGSNGSDDVVLTGTRVEVYDDFGGGEDAKLTLETNLNCRRGAQSEGPSRDVGCVHYLFQLRGGRDLYAPRAANFGTPWWDGRDTLVLGGSGRDDLRGTPVRDNIRGGKGDDEIRGEGGNDRLRGGPGEDEIRGGPGDDRIRGQAGDDALLRGNAGDDEINGGPGRDNMIGNGGRDMFLAEDGERDRVRGGKGVDTCECDGNDNVRSARRL